MRRNPKLDFPVNRTGNHDRRRLQAGLIGAILFGVACFAVGWFSAVAFH